MKENHDDEGLLNICLYNHVNKSSPISNSVYFRRPIGETSFDHPIPSGGSLHFMVGTEIAMLRC